MKRFHDLLTAARWIQRNATGPCCFIDREHRMWLDLGATDGFPIKFAEQYRSSAR